MPRAAAGRGYPHISSTARIHDHRFCTVIEKIIDAALSGAKPWGTPYPMPPLTDEQQAHATRNKLFGAKNCRQLEAKHGAKHSISVMYAKPDGTLTNTRVPGQGGYVLVIRAWPLDTGRRAIVNRVANGEPLAYNPMMKGQA